MDDITVLLTGTGAPGAPGIIKCLRKNGEREIRIVGVDMNADAGGRDLVDIFYKVPPAYDDNFIDSIIDICIEEKVDVIQPLVTKELIKFAKDRNRFENNNIKVNVMDKDILEIVNNKGNLLNALKEHNIPVPKFYIANNIYYIEKAFKKLNYPEKAVCIKITEGNGSRGLRIVNPNVSRADLFFNSKPNSMNISYSELILTLKEIEILPEMMVMEYLPGEEYSVDILADNGEVTYAICRRGTTVVNSIQLGCVIEKHDDIIMQCRDLCRELNLSGNFGLDIKENELGQPLVMEINPRLTAGVVACAAAGVNLPYLGIKQKLGEILTDCDIKYGTRMLRRWEEVFLDRDGNLINL